MPDVEFLPNERASLPFAAAALTQGLILLSGEIGMLGDGSLAIGLERQARQALANIEATLQRLGCDRRNIVKSTIMLKDITRWSEFNAVYAEFFDGLPLPARSAFGVAGLALDAELEIECIAVR